jgi:hypothetical protein
MSWELRPSELVVEARSRVPKRRGGCRGEELEEARERCDSLRKRLMPGSAKARPCFARAALAGRGGCCLVGLVSVCLLCRTVAGGLRPLGVTLWLLDERALVDARGVVGPSCCCDICWSGGGILTGSGNSELRFLLRRGSLKNVVCVDTVCVVVVVEP